MALNDSIEHFLRDVSSRIDDPAPVEMAEAAPEGDAPPDGRSQGALMVDDMLQKVVADQEAFAAEGVIVFLISPTGYSRWTGGLSHAALLGHFRMLERMCLDDWADTFEPKEDHS